MTTYRDPSWGVATRIGALVLAAYGAWYAAPSSIFIKPINMTVIKDAEDRWIMVSERETPWGAITVETSADIQVLGREDGLTCSAQLHGLITPSPNNVARYDITQWAEPCMRAGPPIGVNFSRTVLLGGVLPLRPVFYSFTINPDAAPVIGTGATE